MKVCNAGAASVGRRPASETRLDGVLYLAAWRAGAGAYGAAVHFVHNAAAALAAAEAAHDAAQLAVCGRWLGRSG